MYLIGKMFPLSVIHIIGEIFPFVKINFYFLGDTFPVCLEAANETYKTRLRKRYVYDIR